MQILKAVDLTKRFHGFTALDSVNVTVERGKVYGFVGNNGAGKTTFMRLVCGLIAPDSGTLELFGATGGKELVAAREKVGALIEQPIGYPEMSARQNLRALSMLCKNSSFKEVDEIIELVGLGRVARRSIKNYSTGMRQRYGLAAAMLGKPELLVLDEPMSGIDVEGMDELTELIKRLVTEKQVTVLLSSHQLARMEQIATDYIFIDRGKIIKAVNGEELVRESSAAGGMEDFFRKLVGGIRDA
jgi:ABC-2 type transport system ATP-binding protein